METYSFFIRQDGTYGFAPQTPDGCITVATCNSNELTKVKTNIRNLFRATDVNSYVLTYNEVQAIVEMFSKFTENYYVWQRQEDEQLTELLNSKNPR